MSASPSEPSREPTRWHNAWNEGRIGFHRDAVHADLLSYGADWLRGAKRALVPLCGKTLDLSWLAQHVEDVVGVELVEKAVREANEEQALQLSPSAAPPFTAWRHPALAGGRAGVSILQGDLFALDQLDAAALGTFDRVWDRAALVAIDPNLRGRYARLLRSLLAPGGSILLNAFTYDQSVMDGPPWSVPEDAVRALYDGLPIEVLRTGDVIDESPFRERGHKTWVVTTYRVG